MKPIQLYTEKDVTFELVDKPAFNKILKKYPTLKSNGFDKDCQHEIKLDEVNECIKWLQEQKIVKTTHSGLSSYDCKHLVEKCYKKVNSEHKYISNGAFIVAVIHSGIRFNYYGSQYIYPAISRKCLSSI
jgi:hypothetical protein